MEDKNIPKLVVSSAQSMADEIAWGVRNLYDFAESRGGAPLASWAKQELQRLQERGYNTVQAAQTVFQLLVRGQHEK